MVKLTNIPAVMLSPWDVRIWVETEAELELPHSLLSRTRMSFVYRSFRASTFMPKARLNSVEDADLETGWNLWEGLFLGSGKIKCMI